MNRRQFLKGLSASAAALVVPAAKRDERDAEIVFWKQRAETWEQLFFEWAKETNRLRQRISNMKEVMVRQKELAADLAVHAAYWQEQYEQQLEQWRWAIDSRNYWQKRYEQVKAQRDLLIEDECITLRHQKPLVMDNLGMMIEKFDCPFELQIQYGQCSDLEDADA